MQDFSDWLARLYNHPRIEDCLDHVIIQSEITPSAADIWDAPAMKEFRGAGSKCFFLSTGSEGQLAFSLNIDSFNPFSNKIAGKQVTICGLYLVCLNLSPELCYCPENIFLAGIIPGPSEPTTLQINYILKPLVDTFLKLWEEGVYLMHTQKYPGGWRVTGAIIPLVCDLPAA